MLNWWLLDLNTDSELKNSSFNLKQNSSPTTEGSRHRRGGARLLGRRLRQRETGSAPSSGGTKSTDAFSSFDVFSDQ